jgi:4-amino-4-deoxy-L-arabinose transferase-like glycosyltransferase
MKIPPLAIDNILKRCEVFLRKRSTNAFIFYFIAFLILGFFRIQTVPPLWWDEGWTLQVAKNWVELGHYGRLNAGEFVSPGLSASFPVVATIAASFKTFGVGIWQGRLPGVLITLFTVFILYRLASQLYSPRIAGGALGVLLLMSISPDANFILVGRQVLAEMHSLFYLFAGFALLFAAFRISPWIIIPSALVMGTGIISKAQVFPFWLISLFVPLFIALYKRWWRISILLLIALVGSYYASLQLSGVQSLLISESSVPEDPIVGMYQVFAIAPVFDLRITALRTGIIIGFPTLVGLVFGLLDAYRQLHKDDLDKNKIVLRLALVCLAGSWYLWFLFLAQPFERYLFPSVFIGSIFTSTFIYNLTGGFNIRYVVKNASDVFLKLRISRQSFGSLTALLLLAYAVPLSILSFSQTYILSKETSALEVATYLDEHIPHGVLIETYESQLIFLSDHRFHFPPDQVHVEMVRRKTIDPLHMVDYDPLAADPDYMVIGKFSYFWGLYDYLLSSGDFRLVQAYPNYLIYQRVR